MMRGYYYSTPIITYVNYAAVLAIAAAVAAVLGVILFFTFFRRKNEGRFSGLKGKIYDFMTMYRFYTEDILRFVYIVSTCVITVTGIVSIILGSFVAGILLLVAANLVLRLCFELVMMFVLLCRKTVSLERKVSGIADYYDDGYEEFCGGDCGSCGEDCEGADFFSGFDAFAEDDDEEVLNVNCSGYCESCSEDCSLRSPKIGPDDIPF